MVLQYYIVGNFIAGLTTSPIQIDKDDVKIKEYEYLEKIPQKKISILYASGGTGKTFLLSSLIPFIKNPRY